MNDEILIGRDNGQIDVYRNGLLNRSLAINDGVNYTIRGLCFSTNRRNLYVTSAKFEQNTDTYTGRISLFDNNGHLVNNNFISNLPSNQRPHSCITDAAGSLYIEFRKHAGISPSIRKYDATGRQINQFVVPTDTGGYGSIDLLADQSTLIYVTGPRIRRFDLNNNSSLTDLVNLSDYNNCGAVRARKNGEIWASCEIAGFYGQVEIVRLNANGQMISKFSSLGFSEDAAPKFSPDGVSFWAINYSPPFSWFVTKLGIAGEEQTATAIGEDMYGVTAFAIYGEYTAATTQCSDGIDNDGDSQVDFPNDTYCKSPGQAYEWPCRNIFGRLICLGPRIPYIHIYRANEPSPIQH